MTTISTIHDLPPFIDPYTHKPWSLLIKGNHVCVELGYPFMGVEQSLRQQFHDHLAVHHIDGIKLELRQSIRAHKTQGKLPAIARIKNIIIVASGKGGVGKSTTAVNLALGLQIHGAKVGLLDADIHGPNQPRMLGYSGGKPQVVDKKFQAPVLHGLPTMSMGYLIDAMQPTIWRGPMVSGALMQMLNDTAWPELDYLIIDMPPGTGDIQLTLAQKIPVAGAVIVTTPQEVALADARKGLAMFEKVDVPVLGIVENMAYYLCRHCGEKEYLFGQDGGKRMAEQFNTQLLGEIPLDGQIRQLSDDGLPCVLNAQSSARPAYLSMALQVAAKLSLQSVAYADKFLKVKVNHQ